MKTQLKIDIVAKVNPASPLSFPGIRSFSSSPPLPFVPVQRREKAHMTAPNSPPLSIPTPFHRSPPLPTSEEFSPLRKGFFHLICLSLSLSLFPCGGGGRENDAATVGKRGGEGSISKGRGTAHFNRGEADDMPISKPSLLPPSLVMERGGRRLNGCFVWPGTDGGFLLQPLWLWSVGWVGRVRLGWQRRLKGGREHMGMEKRGGGMCGGEEKKGIK